jgi:4-carboxymuconolactone decarboxylase
MARVPYIEKEQAAPDALDVYNELESMGGRVLIPFKAVANSPLLLKKWWGMMRTLVYELKLDAKLRELAILRVFQITGCEFCFQEHDRIARRVGVPEEQIYNVEHYKTHPAFNDLERLVMRYAEGVARHNTVDEDAFEELKKHLSDQEILELIFCVGNWIGLSHTIVPLGLELEHKVKAPK